MPSERIDILLVNLGICTSVERASSLLMAGQVLVNETAVTKAGTRISTDANIRLRNETIPFVSRGGLKLDGALNDLAVDVTGKTVLDVGASTGGFTDCCLQRGAAKVFAVDVGTNQLDYRLRTDPRVLCFEHTNARDMTLELFPSAADLAVMDVSFISITRVLSATISCLRDTGEIVAMVKPQFEARRAQVGKGGVVRDPEVREQAVLKVIEYASECGLLLRGRADSKLAGPMGNREVFIHLTRVP